MKLLYLANGLPHYFNLVLSRLNAIGNLEVVVVVPNEASRYIGDGVFQSRQGIDFRLIELQEFSNRLYSGFRGLAGVLWRERPDVVMLPEHMMLGFFVDPALVAAKLLTGTRLVLKSIPFQVPDYRSELARLERLAPPASAASRVLSALRLRKPLLRVLVELRAYAFRAIHAHANYVDDARKVYGSYGVAQDRICVTRNSPDTDAMARTEAALQRGGAISRSPYRLLHVGRLVTSKRVDLLLEALAQARERAPQLELVVVGDGPQRAEYEALAGRLGLAGAVRFAGAIYDALELGRHFLSASVFVLPGLGGLSINEAMFYRQAVICSAGDGTERFLVREAENGLFFRAGDAQSLADAMVRIVSDPAALARMGARSRQIIDHEVNIATVVEGYRRAFARARA